MPTEPLKAYRCLQGRRRRCAAKRTTALKAATAAEAAAHRGRCPAPVCRRCLVRCLAQRPCLVPGPCREAGPSLSARRKRRLLGQLSTWRRRRPRRPSRQPLPRRLCHLPLQQGSPARQAPCRGRSRRPPRLAPQQRGLSADSAHPGHCLWRAPRSGPSDRRAQRRRRMRHGQGPQAAAPESLRRLRCRAARWPQPPDLTAGLHRCRRRGQRFGRRRHPNDSCLAA